MAEKGGFGEWRWRGQAPPATSIVLEAAVAGSKDFRPQCYLGTGRHGPGGVDGSKRIQWSIRPDYAFTLTPLAAHHSLTLCPLDLYAAMRSSHSCRCSALVMEKPPRFMPRGDYLSGSGSRPGVRSLTLTSQREPPSDHMPDSARENYRSDLRLSCSTAALTSLRRTA